MAALAASGLLDSGIYAAFGRHSSVFVAIFGDSRSPWLWMGAAVWGIVQNAVEKGIGGTGSGKVVVLSG